MPQQGQVSVSGWWWALSLCEVFKGAYPRLTSLPLKRQTETTQTCKRLMDEFMLYVIQARALRKVFLSIKVQLCTHFTCRLVFRDDTHSDILHFFSSIFFLFM